MYNPYFKRLIDLSFSLIVLLVLAPLIIFITIILCVFFRGKPFFFQMRPGKDERIFRLYKFKTMNDKRNALGELLPDKERLTPMGRLLRKTSMDELPQLLNVLKGDMSLIGPRPLLPRYLPYYSTEEKMRHTVRPGITGWAQVNGRNVLSWKERLEADVFYTQNLSFKLDVIILIQTIKNILFAKDILTDPDSFMKPLDVERAGIVKELSAD